MPPSDQAPPNEYTIWIDSGTLGSISFSREGLRENYLSWKAGEDIPLIEMANNETNQAKVSVFVGYREEQLEELKVGSSPLYIYAFPKIPTKNFMSHTWAYRVANMGLLNHRWTKIYEVGDIAIIITDNKHAWSPSLLLWRNLARGYLKSK
ncbi:hypothetical protein EYR41_006112 [Orbilia oligospora]|uniref:Uncharacterized protein n=1 Tax=Orbilia oligospora TaxID=2813651 RepID=A0A8H2HV71_ORBOL|nr:hypothetical protein EYR41_006112 [Orbilia oligospora]